VQIFITKQKVTVILNLSDFKIISKGNTILYA
jgi:hypothetical protein